MVRRHTGTAFMPGADVFPGGRVDEGDRAAPGDGWCDGAAEAAAHFDDMHESDAVAYHIAAVRELFEEAGVLLARDRRGNRPARRCRASGPVQALSRRCSLGRAIAARGARGGRAARRARCAGAVRPLADAADGRAPIRHPILRRADAVRSDAGASTDTENDARRVGDAGRRPRLMSPRRDVVTGADLDDAARARSVRDPRIQAIALGASAAHPQVRAAACRARRAEVARAAGDPLSSEPPHEHGPADLSAEALRAKVEPAPRRIRNAVRACGGTLACAIL